MLHLTTEIGQPGKWDFEKRHFPSLNNIKSTTKFHPHGRRYIPHGHSEEVQYQPHAQHVQPSYSDCGPDWKSSTRPIATPPFHSDYPKSENWPDVYKPLRTFGGSTFTSQDEWVLDPGKVGYKPSTRSLFDGQHKSTQESTNEVTDAMLFGNGRKDSEINKRNGLDFGNPGDKAYGAVEYSRNFFKDGACVPSVGYGPAFRQREEKIETFIPLFKNAKPPSLPYKEVAAKQELQDEMKDVKLLDKWRPATPLKIPPNSIHGKDWPEPKVPTASKS